MNVRTPLLIAIHNVLWMVAVVASGGIFAGSAGVAYAQSAVQKYWSDNYGVSLPAPDGKFYQFSRLAKAQPDECFDINNPTGSYGDWKSHYPNDLTSEQKDLCLQSGKQLKTNQAYLWGFTN